MPATGYAGRGGNKKGGANQTFGRAVLRKTLIPISLSYQSLAEAVRDLERHGHLVRMREAVDPYLEMAAIQRRLYEAQGPAVLFEQVKGSRFPAVCNLYGTLDRAHFLFRDTLKAVKQIVGLKADPSRALQKPWRYAGAPFAALKALPMRVGKSAPILKGRIQASEIPQIVSWPMDGGPYVLLPQVFTEQPGKKGLQHGNTGMYRVQMAGNEFVPDQEMGLHYQIHRGIGVHHSLAAERGEPGISADGGGCPPGMRVRPAGASPGLLSFSVPT